MGEIQIKAFILQKDGFLTSCQDRMALNVNRGRFVVADGVTNSYRPEIIADELCKRFVVSDIPVEKWGAVFDLELKPQITDVWSKRVDEIESQLTGRRLQHAMIKRTNIPVGASTFAAVELDAESNLLRYIVLGDSTVFVIGSDNRMSMYCSNTESINDNYVTYSDHPNFISADGNVVGRWEVGNEPIREGYVLLMTDGCAEWFQKTFKGNPSSIESIWNLQNNDDFAMFAENCRSVGDMDDDLAIILLKIDASWDGNFKIISCPQLPMITVISDIENGNSVVQLDNNNVIPHGEAKSDNQQVLFSSKKSMDNNEHELLKTQEDNIEKSVRTDEKSESKGFEFSSLGSRWKYTFDLIRVKLFNIFKI